MLSQRGPERSVGGRIIAAAAEAGNADYRSLHTDAMPATG